MYFHFRQNMNLLVYHRLENETLLAELSHKNDQIIHIVDQTASQKVNIN